MFADYQEQVLNKYRRGLISGRLSLRLAVPTAAKLKAECIAVCQENYQKKDEQTLRLFFGLREDKAGYLQAIRNCETDKFKPLINFLRQVTTTTDSKNIELLAWLISFEPRPYQFNFNIIKDNTLPSVPDIETEAQQMISPIAPVKSDIPVAAEPVLALSEETYERATANETGKFIPPSLQPSTQRPQSFHAPNRPKTARAVLWITLPLLTGILVYIFWPVSFKDTLLPVHLPGNSSQCMYWTGSHYQITPCTQTHKHSPVIPLDTALLLHFKRITQPDTITAASIRKIWYFRNRGHYEFYTMGGAHPVYRNRRLLPVTKHMFDKYILILE